MLNPSEIFQFKITATNLSDSSESSNSESKTEAKPEAEITYKTHWKLEENCPYLDGHFPNQPLLPAVGTIDGSIEFLRQALGTPQLNPLAVFNAKFMAPITPGTKIDLSLVQVVPNKWHADWTTQSLAGETQLLARVGLQV